jgi:hypothetical protein
MKDRTMMWNPMIEAIESRLLMSAVPAGVIGVQSLNQGASAPAVVFTLNRSTGNVTFGDGTQGATPPTGTTGNVTATYRY